MSSGLRRFPELNIFPVHRAGRLDPYPTVALIARHTGREACGSGHVTIAPVSGDGPTRTYSRKDVRRLLNLTERQLQGWEKQGLVSRLESYSFVDLVALQTLARLRKARISTVKIRRALTALRDKLREVDNPLVELRIFSEGKQIRVQLGGRTMEPVSGQLLLDFGEEELRKLLAFPVSRAGRAGAGEREKQRLAVDRLFQQALELEQKGAVAEAVGVYERLLELDPGFAGALVNLGTIFFAARELGKAEDYYRQAVETDPEYALAHFNLGNLYDELGDRAAALAEYQTALRLNPSYADAHYNVALLYQSSGQPLRAVRHWKMYLKLDPASPWATIARRELDRLYRETVLVNRERGR